MFARTSELIRCKWKERENLQIGSIYSRFVDLIDLFQLPIETWMDE